MEFAEIPLQLRCDQKPTATKMGVGSNICRLLSLSASSRAPASAPAEAIEVKTQVHPHLTAINALFENSGHQSDCTSFSKGVSAQRRISRSSAVTSGAVLRSAKAR